MLIWPYLSWLHETQFGTEPHSAVRQPCRDYPASPNSIVDLHLQREAWSSFSLFSKLPIENRPPLSCWWSLWMPCKTRQCLGFCLLVPYTVFPCTCMLADWVGPCTKYLCSAWDKPTFSKPPILKPFSWSPEAEAVASTSGQCLTWDRNDPTSTGVGWRPKGTKVQASCPTQDTREVPASDGCSTLTLCMSQCSWSHSLGLS